ncbi:hypothetical protein CH373_13330 [Leptospira perolatii]|uniref:Uncharacterized protein n=1 Tax=Leptospira perolatii TaxID=2023191 RepID=A0A2M9ZL63_9LEPT|nr:hypothetical protein [Leptospira perolatii]PJZ69909.1 hypothetical protein CH360_08355 [Leptospira perolatii]PJZ72683.1 hypothetical protein CH373_13330 [Leptospira perolatii]
MHGLLNSNRGRMRRRFGWILIVPILFLAMGALVWQLWNYLMPDLFHLSQISYLQACGLLLLSHILFRAGRGGGHGPWGRHARMKHREHWKKEHTVH